MTCDGCTLLSVASDFANRLIHLFNTCCYSADRLAHAVGALGNFLHVHRHFFSGSTDARRLLLAAGDAVGQLFRSARELVRAACQQL